MIFSSTHLQSLVCFAFTLYFTFIAFPCTMKSTMEAGHRLEKRNKWTWALNKGNKGLLALPQIFFMQGYQELSSFPDRRLFSAHKQPRSSISARSHPQHWRTTSLPRLLGQPLTAQAQDKMTPVRWSKDKRQTPGLVRKYIHLIRYSCFLKY